MTITVKIIVLVILITRMRTHYGTHPLERATQNAERNRNAHPRATKPRSFVRQHVLGWKQPLSATLQFCLRLCV